MPLLPMEPCFFPDGLFSEESPIRQETERWWVLHTRPRAEKALARRLHKRGISHFLPLFEKRWRVNGRNFKAYMPAFASYVFLFGDAEARLHTLETNLVSQVLHVENQAELESDLRRIHLLMASGTPMAPEIDLQPGTIVEIVDGPLFGLEGKVVTRNRKLRLLVEVRFLNQGVSVELESWMVRRAAVQAAERVLVFCD